jgi:alpha-L-rhamnosidase
METNFGDAQWISRTVPVSTRVIREVGRARVDWVEPGHRLEQSFVAEGPVVAVNVDLSEPRDASDPFAVDVKFSLRLESESGEVVAERTFEGPQPIWDYFQHLLEVSPPAPPGEYTVVVSSERGVIGWHGTDAARGGELDDGVSSLPVSGVARADGTTVSGTRAIGVETLPAPNPVFRRSVDLASVPRKATLSASVLGTGVVSINGVRVGDEAIEPAVTDYDRTILYRSWDVTHLFSDGANEVVIAAGRERFAARGGDIWGWHLAPWHREPTALARIDFEFEDGSLSEVVTDSQWLCAAGDVVMERLFRGEDWVLSADERVWEPVAVVSPPRGNLRRATLPPIRSAAAVPPIVIESRGGSTVYDFGEVMVGRIRSRISGSAGAEVRIRSGEQRSTDGSVVCENILVAGEAQLDTLRLERSTDSFQWEPQFGYRGFRWVEIETEGDVSVEDVRAVPLYTDVEVSGEFSASEPVLEWIDAATARSFRNNLHGIPTDTPIYEKNGWTADAHLATEGLLHHFDLRAAFGKWIDDHIDAQGPDGSIPQIIPTPGWGRASDPAWSASAVLIPWYMYREYGDLDLLRNAAPMIRRFADQVLDSMDNGIWKKRSWGDWLSPGHGTGPEGMAPIGTAMTVTILQHASRVLEAIGDTSATEYAAAASFVGSRYHDEYFDPTVGGYGVRGTGYRQVLDILPLAFGIVPDEHVASTRQRLITDLETRTSGHLDCGAVGVRHLLPVLSAAGRDDLAVTVLTQRTRPSWGVWYEDGERTLLESWDRNARSRNHYFLGSVDAWIQQRVGGLRLTAPGWREFEIDPVDDPRIDRASIHHRTPLGPASVQWERGRGGRRFEVRVPDGSAASLEVGGEWRSLGPGHHVVHTP